MQSLIEGMNHFAGIKIICKVLKNSILFLQFWALLLYYFAQYQTNGVFLEEFSESEYKII